MEIQHFKQMGIYDKVQQQEAKDGGHRVLGARWVGVKKADGAHKSRLAAKDIKT